MTIMNNDDLFELMNNLPDVSAHVRKAREMTDARMKHVRMVASLCNAPAACGEFGGEMSTMTISCGLALPIARMGLNPQPTISIAKMKKFLEN